MKNLTVKAVNTVLFAACGAMLLWAAWDRKDSFYILLGACLFALAVWEGWTWVLDRRAGRNGQCECSPAMTTAFVLAAVGQTYRAIAEPDGFHIFLAVSWALISAAYAVRTVRSLRAADTSKEEGL